MQAQAQAVMAGSHVARREETGPRKIQIETCFGKARHLRSRKERPCDACRRRKSACIITVGPPCRYCESKHQNCTFASSPTQRVRRPPSSVRAKAASYRTSRSFPDGAASEKLGTRTDLQSGLSTLVDRSGEDGLPSSSLADVTKPLRPETQLSLDDAAGVLNDLSPGVFQQEYGLTLITPPRSTISSGDTLDGYKGLTAHFLGPSSDQDANLLSSFRSNILNETSYVDVNIRQVFAGNNTGNFPPVHFNIVHDLFPERENRTRETASERIEEHVAPYADALVRLYFSFIHPVLPVLSKVRFLQAYSINRLDIPASLRGAIYALACPFWERDETLRSLPCPDQVELFEHAHAVLLRELDSPKLATLQSCLLVIHEDPPLTGTTESPRNWSFACQATACAQSLGLHADPSLWNIPEWEKRLRKKLWWITFVTDKWSSLSHGNPSHISVHSYDTMDLTIDDILWDEDLTHSGHSHILWEADRGPNHVRAANVIENVKLAKKLGTLLDHSYTTRTYPMLPAAVTESGVVDSSGCLSKSDLDDWNSTLPECLRLDLTTGAGDISMNGALYLNYFATKSLYLRVIMSPATPLAKSNPFSNLRSNLDAGLEEFKQFVTLITNIKPEDMKTFWGRHSRTHLVHAGNFLIYLFLCASTVEQVEKSYLLLEAYHRALCFLAAVADDRSLGMLRPALLRIESFFKEAIKVMQKGGVPE